jgi:hypothetical protein
MSTRKRHSVAHRGGHPRKGVAYGVQYSARKDDMGWGRGLHCRVNDDMVAFSSDPVHAIWIGLGTARRWMGDSNKLDLILLHHGTEQHTQPGPCPRTARANPGKSAGGSGSGYHWIGSAESVSPQGVAAAVCRTKATHTHAQTLLQAAHLTHGTPPAPAPARLSPPGPGGLVWRRGDSNGGGSPQGGRGWRWAMCWNALHTRSLCRPVRGM